MLGAHSQRLGPFNAACIITGGVGPFLISRSHCLSAFAFVLSPRKAGAYHGLQSEQLCCLRPTCAWEFCDTCRCLRPILLPPAPRRFFALQFLVIGELHAFNFQGISSNVLLKLVKTLRKKLVFSFQAWFRHMYRCSISRYLSESAFLPEALS